MSFAYTASGFKSVAACKSEQRAAQSGRLGPQRSYFFNQSLPGLFGIFVVHEAPSTVGPPATLVLEAVLRPGTRTENQTDLTDGEFRVVTLRSTWRRRSHARDDVPTSRFDYTST